jgi:PAS domain-containing protein
MTDADGKIMYAGPAFETMSGISREFTGNLPPGSMIFLPRRASSLPEMVSS